MTRKLITVEIREEILKRNKTESLTIKQLCLEYGFYYTSFFNNLKRNNIKTNVITNKSKINHFYFNKIDTEEKAYFLGLLYSDGYIEKPNKYNNGRVSLKLSQPDIYMVDKLRSIICPELKLQIKPAFNNIKEAAEISFISKQINKDLHNLGMLYGKVKEGRNYPVISDDLNRHFIRGYFDGDGCISIRERIKTNTVTITIYCPDIHFLNSLTNYINFSVITKDKRHNVYILRLNNNKNKYSFLNYMYKNSSIFLKRKYDIFKSLNFDGRFFY